jgi:hypothetical protein
MQAQDRNQHLRAIASRAGCSKDDIIKAYNDWLIVRTRTQRGTIHVVASDDVWWMTTLCASKTLSSFTRRKELLGIDNHQYDQALQLLQEYLFSWPKLRKQISLHLSNSWIDVTSGMLYNILCFAGSSGIIVQWPMLPSSRGTSVPLEGRGGEGEGFEHAFVLVSQWITSPRQLEWEAALREICLRYFSSHGPATVEDLQWRSGLGKTQIKQWIKLCDSLLTSEEIDGKMYYCGSMSWISWRIQETVDPSTSQHYAQNNKHAVKFLAGFDERLLGYRDRTATLHLDHHTLVDASRNGIFKPTVMINGETIWIRTIKHKPKVSEITITPFTTFTPEQQRALQSETIHYQAYLGKPVILTIL